MRLTDMKNEMARHFINGVIESRKAIEVPPSLQTQEPPVILPKEILTGARKLESHEIDEAVLVGVKASKEVKPMRNYPDLVAAGAFHPGSILPVEQAYQAQLSAYGASWRA